MKCRRDLLALVPSRLLRGWGLLVLLVGACWAIIPTARANDPVALTIGVLRFEPLPQAQARWAPVERALQAHLPTWSIRWRWLTLPELREAVAADAVDVVITSPGHAAQLQVSEGASPALATVVRQVGTKTLLAFGATMVVRADSPLHHWRDLAGRTVATTDLDAFGARRIHEFELWRRGVSPADVTWIAASGHTHQDAIQAVLSGRADAAAVREGVLEALIARGRVPDGLLRVLERQELLDYPYAVSTPLYPEWPVLALPSVPAEQRRRLAAALLEIPPAQTVPGEAPEQVVGFAPPQSYDSVRRVLAELRAPPFGTPVLTWQETARLYAWEIAAVALVVLALLSAVGVLLWQHQRLRALVREQALLSRVMDTDEIGLLVTDPQQRIVRVNRGFTLITGYAASEVLGQTPRILSSGRHDVAFYRLMWEAIDRHGIWHGEIWNRRKDGTVYPQAATITAQRNRQGHVEHYVAVLTDVSWRRQAEARITELTYHDGLTGLLNRAGLRERLAQVVQESQREGLTGMLLVVDLDRFKDFNDAHGLSRGDALLRDVGARLRALPPIGGEAARLTADEFALLAPASSRDRASATNAAWSLAQRVLQALRAPFVQADGAQLALTASVGVTLIDGTHDADELLRQVDMAMHAAKAAGRNTVVFFDPKHELELRERLDLLQALEGALARDELQLYCQPQVDAAGRWVGAEILLRWRRADGTLVSPIQFIPLAEESGLIVPIGTHVLQQACATLRRWSDDAALASLRLAVNVSVRQFTQPDFVSTVGAALRDSGIAPDRLELEVTESMFLHDMAHARHVLQQLDALGVTLALDDFGTGYSALAYLAELPFDVVKIDQRFVARLEDSAQRERAIVSTIVTLGQQLGLKVIAEGVETQQQADRLVALGCHLLQGYHFGRPVPLADFESQARALRAPAASG
ncbi:MAG: EAL domain-containing protein [Tepidimonas sp.]|uniref:EAL domain-containing protein n=1 Tax=Tepidimonas sp. TaxID=2002775 RepID=UPI004054F35B